jgi:hypothetical protein
MLAQAAEANGGTVVTVTCGEYRIPWDGSPLGHYYVVGIKGEAATGILPTPCFQTLANITAGAGAVRGDALLVATAPVFATMACGSHFSQSSEAILSLALAAVQLGGSISQDIAHVQGLNLESDLKLVEIIAVLAKHFGVGKLAKAQSPTDLNVKCLNLAIEIAAAAGSRSGHLRTPQKQSQNAKGISEEPSPSSVAGLIFESQDTHLGAHQLGTGV